MNYGTLYIYSSMIANNSASGSCYSVGGILNEATIFMDLSNVFGNAASQADDCNFGPGGIIGVTDGFWNQGDVTIDSTLFKGNKISNSGDFTMTRSAITGAPEDAMDLYAPTTISNSTIANNGAGINVVFGFYGYRGSASISNSTIVNNGGPGIAGPQGGEGLVAGLSNSIVYGNAGGDCSGSLILDPYNLIGDPSGCAAESGTVNLTGVSPMLSALRQNGGPTPTMIPLPGSPVINAGDPAGCLDFVTDKPRTTDQRLLPSPSPAGHPCGLGAVEVQPKDPGRY